MPTGTLNWIDLTTGKGVIEHAGHEYPVTVEDIEPRARKGKAPVRFDVDRQGAVEHAVNVRLHAGTRVASSQHDFGSLSGRRDARSSAQKPLTHHHPDLGLSDVRLPIDVARKWIELMEIGDLEAVLQLYHPDASYHATGTTATGHDVIHGRLTGSVLLGTRLVSVEFHGTDDTIVIDWEGLVGTTGTKLWIGNGRIAEQWW